MKIHHLNCGTLCPACKRLVNGKGSFFERGKMICHCLLIETSQGLVLVDTGFGKVDVENPSHLGRGFLALTGSNPKREETAFEQVKGLGFKPEDVQHVIVTHLDLDHAGGIPDFPHAQIHVHKPEYQAAMNPHWDEKARYRPAHFAHNPKWKVHDEQGDRWFGFQGLQAIEGLQDDILIVPMAGHTRGHCAVAVRDENGWLVHAGDAYFNHGAMVEGGSQPLGMIAFEKLVQVNGPLRIENQLRLKELVNDKKAGVRAFCAHDPEEFPA